MSILSKEIPKWIKRITNGNKTEIKVLTNDNFISTFVLSYISKYNPLIVDTIKRQIPKKRVIKKTL